MPHPNSRNRRKKFKQSPKEPRQAQKLGHRLRSHLRHVLDTPLRATSLPNATLLDSECKGGTSLSLPVMLDHTKNLKRVESMLERTIIKIFWQAHTPAPSASKTCIS